MFRLWGKIYTDNQIVQNTVICIENKSLTTALKTDQALFDICMLFDLQKPIWLKNNHKDLKQFRRTTFRRDHFIEQIDFDYLEIEIIEDDKV